MSKLQLILTKAIAGPDGKVISQAQKTIDLLPGAVEGKINPVAQKQTTYRVVDATNGKVIKNQILARKANALQVIVDGQLLVEIEEFFTPQGQASSDLSIQSTYLIDYSPSDTPQYGLIGSNAATQYVDNGLSVVWAQGTLVPMPVDAAAYTVQPAPVSLLGAVPPIGLPWGGIAAGAGGAVLAVSKAVKTDEKAKVIGDTTISGAVALGTLLSSSLTVTAYKADGSKLQDASVKADGSYTFTYTGYDGPVTLKLTGTATYANESGGVATFNAALTPIRAVLTGGTGNINAHLNPLTEIAAQKLIGQDSNASPTIANAANVAAVNAALGKFLLGETKDVTQIAADTLTDGGSTSNALGRFLAIVAAAEQKDALTTTEVIARIAKGINAEGTGFSSIAADASAAKSLLQSAAAQAVGNGSLQSEEARLLLKTILLDSSANAAPQVLITADKGIVGKDTTSSVTFTFNQDPGASFALSDVSVVGGVLSNLAVSPQDAKVYVATFTPTLGGTSASLSVSAGRFTAGSANTANLASDTLTLQVDTLAPAAPLANVRFSADTGLSATDLITQIATQSISGTLSTSLAYGEKLFVSLDNGSTWAEVATVGTNWSLANQTLSASNTIKLKVTDLAGNVSSVTSQIYTIDNSAPVTPNAALAADTGNGLVGIYATDRITNSGLITLAANREAGGLVEYRVQKGGATFSAWSSNYSAPATDGTADGDYTVEIRQTDKAGNISGVQSISFTLDSSKPATPNAALSTDSSNNVNASYATDHITNSAEITAPTNTENSAALAYRVQKGSTVVSDWSSSYSAPANDGTADGDYTVEIRQTDKAGNISDTQSIQFTLDSTAPVLSTTTYALPENNAANALVATLAATEANGPVTFSTTLSGADAAKFSIDAQGNLRVLAAKNFESKDDANTDGVYALTVSGTDKAGNSFSQAITVALSDVNEAPVVKRTIANQTFLAGGYSNSFTIPADSFTDVDAGTTFTYSATLADGSALPAWLSFNINTGTFSGSAPTNGSITVKVTATDNGTQPLSASSSFVLTSVVPPTVSSFTVTDNNAGGGSDTTVGKQGDMLTFALTMSEAVTVNGSPTISVKVGGTDITATYSSGSGSNTLTFTATAPAGDSTGVQFNSFNLNGGSVIGNTSMQSWASATVADAAYSLDNTAPVWGSSALTVTEGVTAAITSAVLAITETQASGTRLKFTVTSQSQGNVQLNGINSSTFTLQDVQDGKVKFLHNGSETAPSITLSASDGANTVSKVLAITFIPVDDAPSNNLPLTLTLLEGGDVALVVPTGAVTDVDSGDANVSLLVSNLSANGKFYLASDSSKTAITSFSLADAKAGNIKFLHDGSESAPTFSITAQSGTAASAALAGQVNYTPVDDAPTAIVLSNTTSSLPENSDTSANIKLADIAITDVDGGSNPITLSGTDASSFAVLQNALYLKAGTLLNFEGKPSLSVTLNTGAITQNYALALSDVNEAPVLSAPLLDQVFLINRAGSYTVPVGSFTDPDVGNTLTYSATLADGNPLPAWLTFNPATRVFSGTPTSNGSITVRVKATDNGSGALSVSDDFVLTTSAAATVSSFTVTDNNSGGGTNPLIGKLNDTLTIALTMSEVVTVSGSPTISVRVSGTDVTATYSSGSGSNTLTFTATAPAGNGTTVQFNSFNLNGGTVKGQVTGQSWASATVPAASYTLDNTLPQVVNKSIAITEGALTPITPSMLSVSDNLTPDGNLIFSVFLATRGSFQVRGVNANTFTMQDVRDGVVKFQHNGDEVAPSITLNVSDGVNLVAVGATVTYSPVDDAPSNNLPLTLTLLEGGDVTLVVPTGAVTDVDSGDANVSLLVSNLSANGKFYLASDSSKTAITSFSLADAKAGNIKFLHDGSESAPTFSITAQSGTAASATLPGQINFTPVDDAPVMLNPSLVVTEGQALTLTTSMLGITDPDTSSANLKITATLQTNGNFTLNGSFATAFTLDDVANSRVKFVHDGSEQAPQIRLKVTDLSNVATATDVPVTVSFTNTPDPTVVQTPSFAISEGGSLILNTSQIPVADPDTSADRIKLVLSTIAGGRFEKVSAPGTALSFFLLSELQQGQIRFVHDGSETAPAFSVSATNLDDNSSTASVASNILFSRVNDLPSLNNPSLTITQGVPLVVTQAMLGISDPDNTNAEIKITVNSFANGSFRFNNGPTPVSTFTLKQVADNAITVVDDGSGTKPAFSISVSDLSNTQVGPLNVKVNLNTSANNAPVVDLSNIVVQDGQDLVLTAAILKISDVDTPANLLRIDVSNVQGVRFTKSGSDQTSFTLQDVNDGTIKLSYDSSVAAPKFDIAVTDNAPQTVNVRNVVLAITNKPPQIGTPQLAVTEGMSVVLTQDLLAVYSADNAPADVKINVSNVVGGYFSKIGSLDIVTNFTLADVQASRIQFTHDGSETPPSFDLSANNANGRTSSMVRVTPVFTPVNDAPQFSTGLATNSVNFDENSTAVVFTAPLATDPDGPTLTYQLGGADKDKFSIDGSRNIRFNSSPDFEVPSDSDGNNSYLLNIEATDGSLKATQSLVVYVRNVNDAPSLAPVGFGLTERGTTVLSKTALGISDQDTADSNLVVTGSNITGGRLNVNGQAASTFTVGQLVAGQVVFVHDGVSASPSLSVKVSDGNTTTAVTPVAITYTAIDDAPVVNSVSLSMLQGATLTVSPQMFNITDSDTAADRVVISLSSINGGVFKLNTTVATSFTLADLAASRVTFTHDNTGTSPAFTFNVSDGTNTLPPQSVTGSLSLTNVKPLVQAARLSMIEVGDYTTVTMTKDMLGISDQDNTDVQVTINVSSVSGGTFQKSGTTVTSFTLADVAAGQVSFRHLYGSGTPSFALQAKDLVNAYGSAVTSVVNLVNAPYNVIMGDGSGAGGAGTRLAGAGTAGSAGAGDNDAINGTQQSDLIFGDGSGGGAGGSYTTGSSPASHFAFVAGGAAGSGADQINAGGGDDIVFGDGFTAYGQAVSATGTAGGYGGGGGGGHNAYAYTSPPKGGLGAGAGGVASNPITSASQGGSTTIHLAGTADATGTAGLSSGTLSSGGGGAGVGSATNSVIANALTQAQYQTVLNDVSRGAGADIRVFNQAMGTGADTIDAGDGNDWVFAGGGNDRITGGKGGDRIYTGFGADTILYRLSDLDGSTDYIADFNPTAGDKLLFDFIPADKFALYLSLQKWGNGQRLLIDKDGLGDFSNPDQVVQIGYASTATAAAVTPGATYSVTINYKDAALVSQTKTYSRIANGLGPSLPATDITEIMQSLVTQINADAALTNTYATFEGSTFQFARLDPSNTQTQAVLSFTNITPTTSPLNGSSQPDAVSLTALLTADAVGLGSGTLPALAPELNVTEGQTLTLTRAMLGIKDTANSTTQVQVRNVQNGYFALAGTTTPISSFTLAQVGSVVFVHDGSEAAPRFEMRSDALSLGTFPSTYFAAVINFQNVNDAPAFQANSLSKIINVGTTLRLSESDLGNLADPDAPADALVFTVNLPTTAVFLTNSDTGSLPVTSFTLADVRNNKIALQAANSAPLSIYTANISVSDGQGGLASTTMNIAVDMPGRQKAYIKSLVVIMNGDAAQVMTTQDLTVIAPDSAASDLRIKVNASSGLRFLDSGTLTDITQFSYQDVIDGKVSIQRRTGALPIDTTLVRLTLTDLSDRTGLVDNFEDIVNIGFKTILFGDGALSNVIVPAGTTTALNWDAMGLRLNTAKLGDVTRDSNYYHANSSGQQVANTVFMSNTANAANSYTKAINLTPLANVSWGFLNFYNQLDPRVGWALNEVPVKYLVDYAGADAPIILGAGFTATRGQVSLLSPLDLDIRDADSPASQIVVNVRNVKSGRLELVTAPNVAVDKFTMQDVFDGKVVFRHDGGTQAPSFEIAATNPGMHTGVNLYFNKVQGRLLSENINLAPNPDWLDLAGSMRTMYLDLDTSPENVTISLSNIQGMSGYGPGSAPLVFSWRDFTERDYFSGWQTSNGAQMLATVTDGNSSVSAQITINVRSETTTSRGLSARILMSEEGGRSLVNPTMFKFNSVVQSNLATFNVDSVYGMHLELLSNPGVSISTFNYRQLDGGQLVAVYDGNGVVPQMSLSMNQSFTSGALTGSYVSASKPVAVVLDRVGVDDAPGFAPVLTIGEGQSRTLYAREFNVFDAESYAVGDYSGLQLRVKETEGLRIERAGQPGTAIMQFTYSELDQGLIRLVSLGDAFPVLRMTVSNPDGTSESQVVDASIAYQKGLVNDAPVFAPPASSTTIDQGGSIVVTEQILGIKDIDTIRSKVVLTVSDTPANMHGVFKIADHIATSFNLAQVKAGLVSFVQDGTGVAPFMSLSAADELTTTAARTINLQLNPRNNAGSPTMSDVSGALIIFGDGSGSGGSGARFTGVSSVRTGINGAGDDVTLTGSAQADVIFGDGSGGGEGAALSSVGVGGGAAGSGNDTINAGAGNDIIFGDGFWGDISSQQGVAGAGGYGGGGGGGAYISSLLKAGLGGIGAGDGLANNAPSLNKAVGASSTLFNSGGSAQTGLLGLYGASYGGAYSGGGGAGVNTPAAGDLNNKATTSVIQTNLSDANYLRVLNDVSGGPGADQRVFNQAMGNGNDTLDAGAGNDWVMAGGGNDNITGGSGSDTMWGGLGADRFIFSLADFDGSIDVIKDFSMSQADRLVFTGMTAQTLSQYIKVVTDVGANKTTLFIDQTGSGNFANPANMIVLENSLEFPTLDQLRSAIVFA